MKKVILFVLVFIVATLWLGNGKNVQAVTLPPGGSIEGIYKTDFSEMTLHLNGNRVTGTYKYKGGKIDGVLNGHTLTGTWVQENSRGRMVFVFADDFSSFTGKWGYNENTPSSKWNGTQITSFGSSASPSQSSSSSSAGYSSTSLIEGTYTTDFKDMTLTINGNHVTGTYKHMGGKIDGTLHGNRLVGTWTQTNGRGKLDFVFNSDFSAFTGKWGYNDSTPSSKWNGKKVGVSGSSSSSVQPSSSYSSTSLIKGTYTTDFSEMTLAISGNHVTGTYKYKGGKIDGTLQGNRLTGTWAQTNGRGRLEFIFADDFSSFTGKWSYNESVPSSKWNGTKIY